MSTRELGRAEVLGRLKRKELKLSEAAELMRVSYRQAKRLKKRYGAGGARALAHGNRGRASHRAAPGSTRAKVLRLVRERYGGPRGERLGPTLASEHLAAEHGLAVHRETLRRWMLKEGLWNLERRSRRHRKRRERRAHFGELVQMDGSPHAWLGKRAGTAVLLDLIDDATGRADGRFGAEETIWAAADGLRRWVERHGIPRALYVDHKNVYVRPQTPREALRGEEALTQFGAMCRRLGTEIIAAGSPQAKGRIERGHGTHQDRMVKKMRLAGIATYERANEFLGADYWEEHNRKFAVAPRSRADYHRPVPRGMNLEEVFSLREPRRVSQDWVVRYQGRHFQIEREAKVRPRDTVVVEEQRSGKIRLLKGERPLGWHEISLPRQSAIPATPAPQPPTRRHAKPAADHPWNRAAAGAAERKLLRRPPSGVEMPGHANAGSQTTASRVRTALGNAANNAAFPHFHPATTTAVSI